MKGIFYQKRTFYFVTALISLFHLFVAAEFKDAIPPPTEKEIKEGDCENASLKDMVVQEHIHKPALPLLVRNATLSWHGDYKIYCVIVVPQNDKTVDAESVLVSEGGINHTFITIEIHSKRNEGIDYNIQVFGKRL